MQPSAGARKKPPVGGLNFLVCIKAQLGQDNTSLLIRKSKIESDQYEQLKYGPSRYQTVDLKVIHFIQVSSIKQELLDKLKALNLILNTLYLQQ